MTDMLGPYVLGPNDTPENGIYIGDARELAKAIPDESVDLIFTDPVYQNIDDYCWLAETAERVLKEDRSLLAWTVHDYLNWTIPVLEQHLTYKRLFILFKTGPGGSFIGRVYVRTTPCVWMTKGNAIPNRTIWDVSIGTHKSALSGLHRWSKDPVAISRWMGVLSEPGQVVLDPFTGGGTVPAVCKMLGRKYLAFEILPDVAETARERVRMTQMPLFVLEPEQLTLPPRV